MTGPDIQIGRELLDRDVLPARPDRAAVAILTQPGAAHIARMVQGAIGVRSEILEVPDGEPAKSLPEAERVYTELNRLGLTRHDTVVCVGGGTVTDLGGFVAATYLRGVEAVYVPTTVLGAVDAATGGKTGVNVGGKNLVGVFAEPTRVVIDIGVLEELPEDVRREGLAEALKAGLIADPALVELLEHDGLGADLEPIVRRAVAVKVDVVSGDFRESGRRAILNYGHTIGHAVEVAAGLGHGSAIAVGMVAAGVVSELLVGFPDAARQHHLIEHLGLPTTATFDRARVRDLIGLDKKRDTTGARMVLLERIGTPVVRPVGEAELEQALDEITA
ncbi:MAG: 3-dehydroquinate synthase [Acidimicrobiia bacterium]|nr:3-dehydroquinate synthase [Acidimicrobiia bacterium]